MGLIRMHDKLKLAVCMHPLHDPHQSLDDRLNGGAYARNLYRCGSLCPAQVVIDLLAHGIDLRCDQTCQVVISLLGSIGGIGEDAQRRFKRMGKVAGLRSGTLDHFSVLRQHPKVVASVFPISQTGNGKVSAQQLAEALELDEVIVGEG